jgi:hypothetical protein
MRPPAVSAESTSQQVFNSADQSMQVDDSPRIITFISLSWKKKNLKIGQQLKDKKDIK